MLVLGDSWRFGAGCCGFSASSCCGSSGERGREGWRWRRVRGFERRGWRGGDCWWGTWDRFRFGEGEGEVETWWGLLCGYLDTWWIKVLGGGGGFEFCGREGFLVKVCGRVRSRLRTGVRHWGWREWVCSEGGEGIGGEAGRGFRKWKGRRRKWFPRGTWWCTWGYGHGSGSGLRVSRRRLRRSGCWCRWGVLRCVGRLGCVYRFVKIEESLGVVVVGWGCGDDVDILMFGENFGRAPYDWCPFPILSIRPNVPPEEYSEPF